MLTNAKYIKGLTIRASDGDLGTADQIYFDDVTWAVRYLTVETGGWLGGRRVLISPFSIVRVDWQAKRVDVRLTRAQVENSPHIDLHKPVSRQHELGYNNYFGFPNYWSGPYTWGSGYSPMGFVGVEQYSPDEQAARVKQESADSHLRSNRAVTGYDLQATDGEIGHVSGFVMDDQAWAIRYIEVATRNWWPGKKVLMAPAWIRRITWMNSKVFVTLTRNAIQTAPEYHELEAVTREFEDRLHAHYGQPPYWLTEELASPLSLTNV